ncbi:hypothetical protein GCM10017781_02970 [Deinococcus metalli]|uniref:Uncharacterized protein n=1 Tax=Deinococcus metalli TaxID=1141878 RepID=A0ABQ3JM23_9DEIO|nr:hypothetical protein GCM10017781_02970 [Deinococcus metalli]
MQADEQTAQVEGGALGRSGPGGAGEAVVVGFLAELFGTELGEVQREGGIHGVLR